VGNIPVRPPFVTDRTSNLRQCQELEQVGTIAFTPRNTTTGREEKICFEQFYHRAKSAADFTDRQTGIKAT